MREPQTGTIESVRGSLDDAGGGQVLRVWASAGIVEGRKAEDQLHEVVCVLRSPGEELLGVSWVQPHDVQLLGGRRFWMYRSAIASAAADAGPALLARTFAALEEDFDPDGSEPIGVCLLVYDRAEMERRPEAEWSDPRMLYAGYLPDGGQVRVGYFAGATI